MEITDRGRLALESLREGSEDLRAMDEAAYLRDGVLYMCACGFLARPLGIEVVADMSTDDLIMSIVEATGWPPVIVEKIPTWNDDADPDGNFVYTLREIAEKLQAEIEAYV